MKCRGVTKKNSMCKKLGMFYDSNLDTYFCKCHYKQKCTPTCSICLDDLQNKTDWMITPCKHHFHKECWGRYVDNCSRLECPVCRTDIRDHTNDTTFTLTISTCSYDELIIFSFDPELLFGTNGLTQIKKRNIKHRSNFIMKKYFDYYNNMPVENYDISAVSKNYVIDIKFGEVNTKEFRVEEFPLCLQQLIFNDDSLISIVNRFYKTLHESFHS